MIFGHKHPLLCACCSFTPLPWKISEGEAAWFGDNKITIYFKNENKQIESPKKYWCSSKWQMVMGLQHMEGDSLLFCSQLLLGFHRQNPAGVSARSGGELAHRKA